MEQQGNLRILDARGDLVLAIDTLSDGIALSTRPKLDEIWRLHDMPFSPINFSNQPNASAWINQRQRPAVGGLQETPLLRISPEPSHPNVFGVSTNASRYTPAAPHKRYAKFLVSSERLRSATPYSDQAVAMKRSRSSEPSFGQHYEIDIVNCDIYALSLVLCIIHGHLQDVPSTISSALLSEIAVILQFYGCVGAVEEFRDAWLKRWEAKRGTALLNWLCISWGFGDDRVLQSVIWWLRLHLKYSVEGVDPPVPRGPLVQLINERVHLIHKILSLLYRTLEELQVSLVCRFECDALCLGVLSKEMRRNGLLDPRLVPPYHGVSVKNLCSFIAHIRVPDPNVLGWRIPHYCSLTTRLQRMVDEMIGAPNNWDPVLFETHVRSNMEVRNQIFSRGRPRNEDEDGDGYEEGFVWPH